MNSSRRLSSRGPNRRFGNVAHLERFSSIGEWDQIFVGGLVFIHANLYLKVAFHILK